VDAFWTALSVQIVIGLHDKQHSVRCPVLAGPHLDECELSGVAEPMALLKVRLHAPLQSTCVLLNYTRCAQTVSHSLTARIHIGTALSTRRWMI
jgi:hypothetical protein